MDLSSNKNNDHVVLGMATAMGAFLMFTVMNMFAKLLSDNHSVIEIAFYRNLIASLVFLTAAFVFGKREIMVLRSRPVLVAVRAVFGTISLVVTFTAYSMMPQADTTVMLPRWPLVDPDISGRDFPEGVRRPIQMVCSRDGFRRRHYHGAPIR